MKGKKIGRRTGFAVLAVAVLLAAAAVAYAADPMFSDIAGHWAQESIENMAGLGIVKGHTDGTFGPDEPVTRAQTVTFLDRTMQLMMAPVDEVRRGCPACHQGPFTLKAEAVINKDIDEHNELPADAGLNDCLGCHAPGSGDREGKGVVAPLSLRDIVHPAHLNSKIFTMELMGNCFTCHNVTGEGVFQLLPQAVDVDEHGIPDTVPIPGAQDPSDPQ